VTAERGVKLCNLKLISLTTLTSVKLTQALLLLTVDWGDSQARHKDRILFFYFPTF